MIVESVPESIKSRTSVRIWSQRPTDSEHNRPTASINQILHLPPKCCHRPTHSVPQCIKSFTCVPTVLTGANSLSARINQIPHLHPKSPKTITLRSIEIPCFCSHTPVKSRQITQTVHCQNSILYRTASHSISD